MKVCKYCNTERPEEAFEVCKIIGGKIYRRQKCQKCKQAARARRRSKIRLWLDDFKRTMSCERCGFKDHRALEFHHTNHWDKRFNVADMIRYGSSIKKIMTEISKCRVLCSNCHRIEHHEARTPS